MSFPLNFSVICFFSFLSCSLTLLANVNKWQNLIATRLIVEGKKTNTLNKYRHQKKGKSSRDGLWKNHMLPHGKKTRAQNQRRAKTKCDNKWKGDSSLIPRKESMALSKGAHNNAHTKKENIIIIRTAWLYYVRERPPNALLLCTIASRRQSNDGGGQKKTERVNNR